MSQQRRPAGTPIGGQFAPSTHPRPGFELEAEPEPEPEPEPEAKPTKPPSPAEQAGRRYLEARKKRQPRELLTELAYEWGRLWGLAHPGRVAAAGATPADVAQQTACQAAEGRRADPRVALREHAAGVLAPGERRTDDGDNAQRLAGQMARLGAEGLRPEVAIAAWRQRHGSSYRGVSDEALRLAWQRAQPAPALPDHDRGLAASGDAFAEVDERLRVAAAVARVREDLLAEAAAAEAAGKRRLGRRVRGIVRLLDLAAQDRKRLELSEREAGRELGVSPNTAADWLGELRTRFTAALISA